MQVKPFHNLRLLFGLWNTFEHFKAKAAILLFMLVITSFLEAISAGMLLPVLEIVVEEKVESKFGDIIVFLFQGYTPEKTLSFVIVLFFLVIVLKNVFVYIKNRVNANLSFGLRGYWMKELMKKYLKSNYSFIVNSKQGTLINNVLVESEKAQHCLKFLVQFLSAALLSGFMLGVLFLVSWKITGALLVVVGLLTLLSHNVIGLYSRRVGTKKLKYSKWVGNSVAESIAAIKQVKTLGMEDRVLDGFSRTVVKYVKTLSDFRVYSSVPQSVGEVVVVLILVMTMIYIISFTEINMKGLVPIAAVFVVVGNRISVQASLLVNSSMQILSNIVSLRRIYDLIKDDVGLEDLNRGRKFEELEGDIEFKDVTFSYKKGKPVFKALDFVISKGKFVFLIGSSGSGKSTLVDLLLRLRTPQSGAILVNGTDISEISLKSWRDSIGYVSQDSMLFSKSIKENVRDGGPSATDEEILSTCEKVNAHKFIRELPEGYNSEVGDRGVKLSGGQQQRLVLARSLLRDPEILIFDEATNALDQKLEEEIIREIKTESEGKTVLFITHRLSITVHADLVYQLSDGKITRIS